MAVTADYNALGKSDRERLTLLLAPSVKAQLKAKAHELRISQSAYVTMLVHQDERRSGGRVE